jgi:hypothetical protein
LAYFAVPQQWWIRTDALPLNDTGKVDKPALQKAFPVNRRS